VHKGMKKSFVGGMLTLGCCPRTSRCRYRMEIPGLADEGYLQSCIFTVSFAGAGAWLVLSRPGKSRGQHFENRRNCARNQREECVDIGMW
jgi:hypothetical protein